MKRFVLVLVALGVLGGIVWSEAMQEVTPLLVDSGYVLDRSDEVVIVEIGRTPDDFAAGHIPGARYFDRSTIYGEVEGISGMFPGVESAIAGIVAAGISSGDSVVIYDNARSLWAARLFWTLEYLGHDKVSILDGGLGKWTGDGLHLETDAKPVSAGSFYAKVQEDRLVDVAEIVSNIDEIFIIDTRSPAEYAGKDVRAARGGHIPGAVNINWIFNITEDETPTFLPLTELGEFYDSYGVDESRQIVTLCQTGVRGAHTYFALRFLGYKNVALYDGSWAEWGNSENQIETPSGS